MFMEINSYSIPALAYLGDSVFELTVRKYLVLSGLSSSVDLNHKALDFVTANHQSMGLEKILPHLDEYEMSFYKRGKNHKSSYHPKSADIETYHKATGLEVIFAMLYLKGESERIDELFRIGFLGNDGDNT